MALISKYMYDVSERIGLNWSTSLKISGLGLLGFALIYCGKIWNSYQIFNRIGLKTPKYQFFFGHLSEILEKTHSECLQEWTRQYGKTYGYFEGHLPIIVTSDLDIIQEVFIKQFSSFIARKEYPFQFTDDDPKMDLFLSTNKRWKRMRNIINPTFSPSKLKELMPIMQKSTERFLEVLSKHENEEIIISDFLNRYTLDTIWNSAVGMDIDCQNNPDNMYMKKALHVFKDLEHLKFAFRLTTYMSEFRAYILGMVSLNTWFVGKLTDREELVDPLFWLTQNIHNVIQDRERNNINRVDFTQLLMDSKIEDHEELKKKEKVDLAQFRLDREISFEEIKFNLVGFLLAGFETTSTALNYCFYILANHPDELVKLHEELDMQYPVDSNIKPNFENVNNCEYLDLFIKETLRMYPISSKYAKLTVNRRCMFSTTVKGLNIPAGVSFTVDVLSLHYDPEIWGPVDPEEFYPLRFSPEFKRNSNAYLPWGIGPRNCVGMRYAQMEMKLALAKTLLKYDVLPTENTPNKLHYIEGTVRRPKTKIPIMIKKRAM